MHAGFAAREGPGQEWGRAGTTWMAVTAQRIQHLCEGSLGTTQTSVALVIAPSAHPVNEGIACSFALRFPNSA